MNIDIKTKNLHEFDELAYLLDFDNTREAISEIRKCWKIPAKLVSYTKFDKWFAANKDNLYFTREVIDQLTWIRDQLNIRSQNKSLTDYEIYNREAELGKIYDNPYKFQVEFISRKIGIAAKWRQLLLKAIICGKVMSKDYKEAKEQSNEYEYNNTWLFEGVRLAIMRIYKGSKRSKTKIDRNRKWHFAVIEYKKKHPNELGVSGAVLDYWNSKCPNKSVNHYNKKCKHCIDATTTIEQALSRYNKFLQS